MNTYKYLLSINNSHNIIKIICTAFMIIVLLMLLIDVYDKYDVLGIYDGKDVVLKINKDNSDDIKNSKYLKINNKKVNYQIENISNLKVENYINYYEVKISTNLKFQENEVVEMTFYNNKEKIIKKIMKIIF